MTPGRSSSSDHEERVLRFPLRGRNAARLRPSIPSPVADLAKFERGNDCDDYRHRMLVNVAAFVFVVGLIGAGLWLADAVAQLRKEEDCVLSGRRGCMPVEVHTSRW